MLAAGTVAAAVTAPASGVSTEVSSNWSGYAVSGKRFTAVSAGPSFAGSGAGSSGGAVPGTLSAGGRSFSVTWTG